MAVSVLDKQVEKRSARSANEVREERIAFGLIVPSIIIPTFLMAAFIFGVWMSFTNWRLTTGFMGVAGLANYERILGDSKFWHAVRLTFGFAVVDVPIQLVLGLGLALALNERIKGQQFFRSMLIVPLMTPPVVGSMFWRVLMRPTGGGIFNFILAQFGIPPQGFLGSPEQVLPSLLLIDVWLYTPFVATILLAGLQSLPRDPYESALVDGANSFQCFRYITLPLLVPFFIVVLFFRSIDALNVFDTIYGTTSGGPGIASRFMTFMGFEEAFPWYNLSIGISVLVFLWAACMLIGYLLYRWVKSSQAEM